MTIPILRTKLYIPPLRAKVVSRPQLIARLREDMEYKLTLISAPAGFGKTTLVSEWVTGCKRPVAWVSLDDKDNDLTQFLAYFVAALKSIQGDIGEGVLEALSSPQSVGIESILTTLINDITDISCNFVFVLDDYHVIDNNSVNNAVVFLIDHMPANLSLVITTRVDPLLNFARLRARNQLMEIRAEDLRFSHSEAAEFFKHVMRLNLSDKDLVTLETRTEGWVAGLQLAAISMQGQRDITGFIETFSGNHYFIMDYLIEEVLKQQSEEIQSFLLQTSILDRLCGSLCDTMMLQSSPSGQKTLEYLQLANLFIVPLDNERRWYRYHHLFADLLRQRLSKEFRSTISNEGRDIAHLHIRASEWFEKNGLISEAVNHAVIAKDFERAAALIELAWAEMDKSMQSATWLGWVKMIPEELVCLRPVLSVGYAWALLDIGEFEGCELRLQDAEKGMDRLLGKRVGDEDSLCNIVVVDEEQFHFLPATIESARAYHASALGDIKATIKHSRRALNLCEKEDYHGRNIVDTLLGLALWANGELETAYSTIAVGIVNIQIEIMVTVVLAEIKIEQGNLQQAASIYQKSLEAAILEETESYQTPIASFYLGLGKLRFLKGDLKGAEVLLKRSKEQGEKTALPTWRYNWYLLQARIKESQGKLDQALDLLNEAEKYYFRSPIPNIQPLDALKTQVLIKQGKTIKATDWMKERELTMEAEIEYLREFEYIILVRVLISEFRHSHNNKPLIEAKQLIERLLKEAQKSNRIGRVIEIFILQALAHEANDDMELAIKSLKEAILLTKPEEHFQIFVDEGLQMHRLLSESDIYKIMPDYVSKLLTAIEEKKIANESREASSRFAQGLIEPLSERELEILQLISQGLSNREICERLFLALSTVKGYNQNLYGKLQVKSRTEAIVRARELKLL